MRNKKFLRIFCDKFYITVESSGQIWLPPIFAPWVLPVLHILLSQFRTVTLLLTFYFSQFRTVPLLLRGEELHLINNINLLIIYLRRNYINANNIMLWNVNDLNDHRTNNDMTNRVTNFWGFMLFMLKETCLMHAMLMRMRGGEIMQGRRRKYKRNEDRIELCLIALKSLKH